MAPRSNVPGGMPPELLQHIAQALPTGRDRVALAAASRETGSALIEETAQATQDHGAAAEEVEKLPPLAHPHVLGLINELPESQRGEALLMQLRRVQAHAASHPRGLSATESHALVRAVEDLPEDQRPPGLNDIAAPFRETAFNKSFDAVKDLNEAVALMQKGERGVTTNILSKKDSFWFTSAEFLRKAVTPAGVLREGPRYVEHPAVGLLRKSKEPHHIEAIQKFDALLHPPAQVEPEPAPFISLADMWRPRKVEFLAQTLAAQGITSLELQRLQQGQGQSRAEAVESLRALLRRPPPRVEPLPGPSPLARRTQPAEPIGAAPRPQASAPVQEVDQAQSTTAPAEHLLRNTGRVVAAASLFQRDRNMTIEQAERFVQLPPNTLRNLITEDRTLRGAAQLDALAQALEPGQVAGFHTLVQRVRESLGEPPAAMPPSAANAPGQPRGGNAQDKGKRPESN